MAYEKNQKKSSLILLGSVLLIVVLAGFQEFLGLGLFLTGWLFGALFGATFTYLLIADGDIRVEPRIK